MKKKKPYFNPKEREIIRALHLHGGYMTAHEIAEVTGISYVTVRKYLRKLHREGVIKKEGEDYGEKTDA